MESIKSENKTGFDQSTSNLFHHDHVVMVIGLLRLFDMLSYLRTIFITRGIGDKRVPWRIDSGAQVLIFRIKVWPTNFCH